MKTTLTFSIQPKESPLKNNDQVFKIDILNKELTKFLIYAVLKYVRKFSSIIYSNWL